MSKSTLLSAPATAKKTRAVLQRRAIQGGGVKQEEEQAPPLVHDVLRASGAPLDADTREWIEPLFGCDFSQVRVHADQHAADSARQVGALAYTVGKHVVFGA